MTLSPFRVAVPLLCTLLLAPLGATQEDAEVRSARQSIERLMAEAKELRAAGKVDRAEQAEERAADLKRRLAEAQPAGDRGDLKETLAGLKAGVHALQRLGRHDEAERLARIAEGVARELESGQREREVAKHQLELYQQAAQALREADKHDGVELLERAIRAQRVALEGHGEEAAALHRKAPDLITQAELLLAASRLWEGWGHETKAAALHELGSALAEKAQAGRGGKEPRAPKDEARLERLEHQVRELAGAVERLSAQVRKLGAR